MSRKYKKIKELLPIVIQIMELWKIQQKIANELFLDNAKVVKNLLYRYCHKSYFLKQRGRKPAKTLHEYKYENTYVKEKGHCIVATPQ